MPADLDTALEMWEQVNVEDLRTTAKSSPTLRGEAGLVLAVMMLSGACSGGGEEGEEEEEDDDDEAINEAEAVRLLEASVALAPLPHALYTLASCTSFGVGTALSAEKGLQLMREAAAAGSTDAVAAAKIIEAKTSSEDKAFFSLTASPRSRRALAQRLSRWALSVNASADARAYNAAMIYEDLKFGRLEYGLRKNAHRPVALDHLRIRDSVPWTRFVISASLVHCLCAFGPQGDRTTLVFSLIEGLMLFVILLDVFMEQYCIGGLDRFLKGKWQRRVALIAAGLSMDYIFPYRLFFESASPWFIPAGFLLKFLRPGIIICRVQEFRHFFDLCLTLLPKMLRLGKSITMQMMLYSVIGSLFFQYLLPGTSPIEKPIRC